MSRTALDPVASAAVITQAREGRTPRPLDFPVGLRPRDATEAYAVQDAVVRARGPIAGWKVGAASPQAQPARAALTRDSVWVAAAGEPVLLAASISSRSTKRPSSTAVHTEHSPQGSAD